MSEEIQKNLIWPDYKNCIANLPNSILKKLGAEPTGDTLPLADKYLEKDYKNIVLLLLDGMGKSILERHLEGNGAFRSHLAGITSQYFFQLPLQPPHPQCPACSHVNTAGSDGIVTIRVWIKTLQYLQIRSRVLRNRQRITMYHGQLHRMKI